LKGADPPDDQAWIKKGEMKSRKLALLLTLAIAAQTALAPVSSMSTVFAAATDPAITTDADDAVTEDAESDEEITSSATETETETKENSATESEEQTLSEEDTVSAEEPSEDLTETETETTVEVTTEADELKEKKAKDKDEVELLGESMPEGTPYDGFTVLDKYYESLNGKGYGFSFGFSTPDGEKVNYDYHASKYTNVGECVYYQIDSNPAVKVTTNELNDYLEKFGTNQVGIKAGYIDGSLPAGEHTVKLAVNYNGTWYTNSNTLNITLCPVDSNTRSFDKSEDTMSEGNPKAEYYCSGRKDASVTSFYFKFLAKTGDKVSEAKLVKHGTDEVVGTSVEVSAHDTNCSSYESGHYPDYDGLTFDSTIIYQLPIENFLACGANFKISKNIEDGWCDVKIKTEKGLDITIENTYYATTKPLIWGMGYRLPWYYGEVLNTNECPYVAAYIYGLNLDANLIPTYYDGEKPVTTGVAYQEPIIMEGGYTYLLNKSADGSWDSLGTKPSLKVSCDLPTDCIDTRSDEVKNNAVKVDIDKQVEGLAGVMWADGNSLDGYYDYYGRRADGNVSFKICELYSMETLYSGNATKDKYLADMIPSGQRYKFDTNKKYRVLVYDAEGHLVCKDYYNRFKTGQPTADSVTISVDPTEATIEVGGTKQLVPTVGPDSLADKSVTYKSSKTSVATVAADGTVTGVAPGTAEITVTTKTGSKKAKAVITVVERIVPVTGITISEQDEEISAITGDSYRLAYTLAPSDATETDVEFISDNENVVKTNAKDGMLYMVGTGEANITVKITSPSTGLTYSDTCKVTVTKKPVKATSVSLGNSSIIIKPENGIFRLYATVNPSDADDKRINWNCSNWGLFTQRRFEGLCAILYPNYRTGGEATIWIEHADGFSAECKVTVLKADVWNNDDYKDKSPADDGEEHDIWISTIPDQTYTGSKITPEIRVYDGNVMLTKGTDYTVTYANNVNVGSIGATKNGKNIAPRAVVKFKGNYKGISLSRSFNILPLSIEANTESDFFDAPDITIDFKDGKIYKPVPVLKRNGKKLKAGKDFDYVYLNEGNPIDSIKNNNLYTIEINAKGNYTGKKTIHCDAIGKGGVYVPISSLKITLNPSSYEYDPEGVTPSYTVTYGGEPVDPKMYAVTYLNDSNKRVGTATMVFKANGVHDIYEFVGEKRVTFKITGTALNKAVNVEGIENKTYTGEEITQGTAKLTLKTDKSKVLVKDTDYTVSYSKNISVGTATVTFKGIGGYSGSVRKTFKIDKAAADDIKVEPFDNPDTPDDPDVPEVPYAKGGAKLTPRITYNGKTLTLSKDYTLSYKHNTVLTTSEDKNKPEITIKFKGNYSGQKTYNYKVVGQSINKLKVSVSDKVYGTKAYSWMSAPVITDVNGKKLKAGVDYEKITVGNYDYFGKNWGDNPQPGTRITVTVKGKGNYTGEREVDYHIFSNNISKAKFKIKDRIYAGNYVTLSKEDFTTATLTVKENGRKVTKDLVLGTDFAIVSYEKNLKKGTATVYIKGIGGEYDLGGTRKLTFKITAKDSATLSNSEEEWF